MLTKVIDKSYEYITTHFSVNLFTNLFGLARTILGLSLLLTLLFNRYDNLYPHVNNAPCNTLLHVDSFFNDANFFLLLGLNHIRIMYWAAIILMLFVVVGVFPRLFCIIHWYIQFSFINSSSCVDGGDQIASNLALLFIPIYLLDSRTWHWSNLKITEINYYKLILSNIMHKLIRLQMCVIYFHAAVGKFDVKEWRDGTAVYYWMNSSFFKMSPNLEPITMFLFSSPLVIGLITWGVMILEILLAFGLISDLRHRRKLFIVGVSLHFLFMLYFGLVSFFLIMLCGLIFYLYPPNTLINFDRWKRLRLS